MRTGSRLNARFTGQAGKEFTWFSLRTSRPLISMDTERAGRQVVEAVRVRRAEVNLTPAGQIVSRVAGLFPGMTSQILHQVQRLALAAPPPGREADGDGIPGHALTPALPRKAFDRLTAWGQAVAIRFNERRAASGLLSGAAARSPLATTTTWRN